MRERVTNVTLVKRFKKRKVKVRPKLTAKELTNLGSDGSIQPNDNVRQRIRSTILEPQSSISNPKFGPHNILAHNVSENISRLRPGKVIFRSNH